MTANPWLVATNGTANAWNSLILTDDTFVQFSFQIQVFLSISLSQFFGLGYLTNDSRWSKYQTLSPSLYKQVLPLLLRLAELPVSHLPSSRPCQLDSNLNRLLYMLSLILYCCCCLIQEIDSRVWQVTTSQVTMSHLDGLFQPLQSVICTRWCFS